MMKEEQLERIRHSLSHLMSMAILEIYPKAGLGVGPFIENGFYQDYDLPENISEKIFPRLEKRMRQMIRQKIDFVQHNIGFNESLQQYKHDPYKTELTIALQKSGEKDVSFYKSDWFENLCKGPHVKNTSEINPEAFKLTKIAGAYWRGNEKNPMLTRIYGVAFATKLELEDYIKLQEEIKKRDHRKLGADLDLFTFADQVGKGLPMLTPRGAVIRRELERYIVDEEIKRGYLHVVTPPLAKVELYKTSGHYPYYKDTMYPVMKVDEDELILRPMTCPHHFMLFKDKPHSYRELPLRIAEIAQQFRYEKSGELTGLMRVRVFNLADSHIFCAPEQVETEISNVLKLIDDVNKTLGLKKGEDYRYRLSLGDRQDTKKYAKNDAAWDLAENILRRVLKKSKAPFYEAPKEAAFYGPKIDVQIRKINSQEETAFTVQYDFVMPERFNLEYIGQDGKTHRPVVIHRSSIGALERTIAFLLEHYAGALPLWLAPVHVAIIPVGLSHEKACAKLGKEFREAGLRVEVSSADQSVGKSIRDAEKKKVPYMLVIGDKESKSAKLHLREHGKPKLRIVSRKTFITDLQKRLMTRQG
jgi:threonyl-tRNA synthetase